MVRKISPEAVRLFDRTAHKSRNSVDSLIACHRYVRGEMFLGAVRSRLMAGAKILDYGCGRGRIARMVAEQGYRVNAMDPSSESLKEAADHGAGCSGLTFSRLDGSGECLESGGYDGIICSSVIEFVDDVPAVLRNFRRALRDNGSLFISFANRLSLWRVYAKWRFGRTGMHFKVQKHEWTPGELRKLLKSVGFRQIRTIGYFEPPFVKRPVPYAAISNRFLGSLGLVSARRDV